MKIICPHCKRITELEHVSHGCNVECVCSREFKVDDSTILEEYSEIDSIIPEQIGQYQITEFPDSDGFPCRAFPCRRNR